MKDEKIKRRSAPNNYSTVIIPHLEADEALQFVGLLEHIIQAVWLAHGDDMHKALADNPTLHTWYYPPSPSVLRKEIQWTHEVSLHPPLDEDDLPF